MAAKKFTELSTDLQKLEVAIRNVTAKIDALRRSGASLAEIQKQTGKEVESLTKAYDRTALATAKYVKSTGGANAANKDASARNIKLTGDVNKTRQAMSTLDGVISKAVTPAINENKKSVSATSKEYGKLQGAVDKMGNSGKNLSKGGFFAGFTNVFNAKNIGAAAARVLTYAGVLGSALAVFGVIKKVVGDSIKTFIEFEDKMGRLGAITQATGGQLKAVELSIREVAQSTRFTANQTADLAISLSKLGATSSELKLILEPVALAAQAMGTSLDETGTALFKVQNQFGLGAGEIVKTSRVLVEAVNGSALSLESFSTAVQYVGPIARQAGATFEETAAYMRLLADNGFTASRIGTGLRKIFLELETSGKGLSETLDNLAKDNISLSEAEELVGKTAAGQLIVLSKNTEAIKLLTDENLAFYHSLTSTASAMSTSAAQMDILKSAYDEFKITLGSVIQDSEIFIGLIGLFSTNAKEMARAYKTINKAMLEDSEILREVMEQAAQGQISTQEAALRVTLLGGDENANKLLEILNNVVEKTGLARKQIIGILNEGSMVAGGDDQPTWYVPDEALDRLGVARDKYREIIVEINSMVNLSGPGMLEAMKGVEELLNKQIKQERELKRQRDVRKESVALYKKDLDFILGQETSNGEARKKASELELKIQETLSKIQLQNLRAQYGLLKLSENQIADNELRISELQNALSAISEYTSANEEEQEKARQKREKLVNDAFKKEKKALDELLENRKQLLKEEEELYSLRIKSAELSGNGEDALRLNAELTEKQAKANDELTKSILEFQKRWQQTYVVVDGQKLQNAIDAETLEQAVDSLVDKIADLKITPDDIRDWIKSVQRSISSVITEVGADAAKEAADKIFAETINKLKELGFTEEQIAYFQELFTLTIYPTVDTAGVEETEKIEKAQEAFNRRMAAAQKAADDNAIKQAEDNYGLAFELLKSEEDREIDAVMEKYFKLYQLSDLSAEEIAELKRREEEEIAKIKKQYTDKELKAEKDKWKRLREIAEEAVEAGVEIYQEQQDAALDALKARLEQEKDLISERAEYEEKLLDAQIENQLISQEEYASRLASIKKKEIQGQNQIDKKIFEEEQKRDKQNAFIDFLGAVAQAFINEIKAGVEFPRNVIFASLTSGIATARYASQLSAINQRKFYPKKFAEGGVVDGPSHANGGIPFTVKGQGGYEMEGGEYIVNKYSTQKYKSLLDKINGTQTSKFTFARGGVVDGNDLINKQLEYLEAIAEATVNTSINVSKPVRAFVSSDDISRDETARRIKERNRNL